MATYQDPKGRASHARTPSHSASSTARPAGTRFKQQAAPSARTSARSARTAQASRRSAAAARGGRASTQGAVGVSPHAVRRTPPKRRSGALPVVIALVAIIAVVGVVVGVGVGIPAVTSLLTSESSSYPAGEEVQITIPEGATGDQIASILSENHIIEDPKVYYAAVREQGADMSLKPGDYLFTTGQDPASVVKQLVAGPNVEGVHLTIQEGLTVAQTAARVEEVYGIPADDFIAQAKASNYVGDYAFLEGAYDDSLEGFLYPKTYTFSGTPTADQIIRALLDQFETETAALDLANGPAGLSTQQIVTLASLVERETAVDDERPLVASVIYNRLEANMPLQIDAAIVYARGGGSQAVTYDDLEIDSPYNVYQNTGLTPGPICSPSVSSIEAALSPADTDYLYYVASAASDGTHKFSSTYDEFLANRQEYQDSLS